MSISMVADSGSPLCEPLPSRFTTASEACACVNPRAAENTSIAKVATVVKGTMVFL